jgi:DNA-binding response OmpR family regulator
MALVLLVEPDANQRELLTATIEAGGHTVMRTQSFGDAVGLLRYANAEVLVTEVDLKPGHGLLLAEEAAVLQVPTIFIGARYEADTLDDGRIPCLRWPFSTSELYRRIEAALASGGAPNQKPDQPEP